MAERASKRDGTPEVRVVAEAPSIDDLRCPHCSGRSFRNDSLRHLGRIARLTVAIFLFFSAIQITLSVNTPVDWVIAVLLSPLPYALIAAVALLFGGSLQLRICTTCGYTFAFDSNVDRTRPQL